MFASVRGLIFECRNERRLAVSGMLLLHSFIILLCILTQKESGRFVYSGVIEVHWQHGTSSSCSGSYSPVMCLTLLYFCDTVNSLPSGCNLLLLDE